MRRASFALCIAMLTLVGCGDDPVVDAGGDSGIDGGTVDGDGGGEDGGGETDAQPAMACEADEDCDDGDDCSGDETCVEGFCSAGTALADGTTCDVDADAATRDLCVDGACGAASCGDGYVDDTTGEECDDANGVRGDGCDDCRFTCEVDAECDDGQECNGEETCSAEHVCIEGTDLGEDAECASGTGTCQGGTCLADSCAVAADCDDANVCNGLETCGGATVGCMPGTALDCDDENDCTADSCDPVAGCQHTPIDADLDGHSPASIGECGTDCDDTDPTVNDDATEICGDSTDNDCDGETDEVGSTTWYADCDGDSFAATGARTLTSCVRPGAGLSMCTTGGGWTARMPATGAADCNDANATVRPNQTVHQSIAIAGAAAGADFDYDCDGTEERRDTTRGSCSGILGGCTTTEGWENAATPECGASADFVTGCTGGIGCSVETEERTQTCL